MDADEGLALPGSRVSLTELPLQRPASTGRRPPGAPPRGLVLPSVAAHTVHLPPWRTLLRQAARQLLENALAPTLVFYLILVTVGLTWAMVGGAGLCYL